MCAQLLSRLHQSSLSLLVAVVRRARRHGLCYMTVVSSLVLPMLPSPSVLRTHAVVRGEARLLAALGCASECMLQVCPSNAPHHAPANPPKFASTWRNACLLGACLLPAFQMHGR